MDLLHLLGHNRNWAMDAYFQNQIGSGFIFGAFSFPYSSLGGKISGYGVSDYIDVSFFDPQFYANKQATGGELASYPFHPLHAAQEDKTELGGIDSIFHAVEFQEDKKFLGVIVPNFYKEKVGSLCKNINKINSRLAGRKQNNKKYYLTIPIPYDMMLDEDAIEEILEAVTDKKIVFDGYYLACEGRAEFRSKLCLSVSFMSNLLTILRTLKRHKFEVIYSHANFDALVYYALADIDYITIGTYENLRKFTNDRYLGETGGGPSKGWYFSEKLLNFIKADHLSLLRSKRCLDKVANEDNMFSDVILQPYYAWNIHKPDVHKNYLLAMSKLFNELSRYPQQQRARLLIDKVERARDVYEDLWSNHRIKLPDESSDKHLGEWLTFLNANSYD